MVFESDGDCDDDDNCDDDDDDEREGWGEEGMRNDGKGKTLGSCYCF